MKLQCALAGVLAVVTVASCQRLIPVNSLTPQGQYNSPCIASSQCRQDLGLYCVPSSDQPRCRCPTNGTVFDEKIKRCVGKIFENCVYQGNSSFCPQNSHCSHQDPRNPSLYYYDTRCFCDPNFIPHENGTCIQAARYGEYCSKDKKCDALANLVCDQESNTCICEFDTESYYEKEKGKCLSFINKRCTTYSGCVLNARCEGLAPTRSRTYVSPTEARKPAGSDKVILNQQPRQRQVSADGRLIGKCVCEYGFTPANNGRCMASYKFTCSGFQQCNPLDNLQCSDGTCTCRSPLHQYFDHDRKKCVSLAGGTCSGPNEECVDNAQCINNVCKCKKSYSQTPHRKCALEYESVCENEKCNVYSGLTCKSKQCVCMDESLIYDKNLKKCVSPIGNPCGKIGHTGEYGKESYYVTCEPPATCKPDVEGDLSTSFCRV